MLSYNIALPDYDAELLSYEIVLRNYGIVLLNYDASDRGEKSVCLQPAIFLNFRSAREGESKKAGEGKDAAAVNCNPVNERLR